MKITTPVVLTLCLIAAAGCRQTQMRGPEGQTITTTTPRSISVHRGGSVALEVGIDRERYTGPVKVTVSQLPRGVRADRPSATFETTSATFVLEAAPNADLVTNQQVAIIVSGLGGRETTQYVELDVLE